MLKPRISIIFISFNFFLIVFCVFTSSIYGLTIGDPVIETLQGEPLFLYIPINGLDKSLNHAIKGTISGYQKYLGGVSYSIRYTRDAAILEITTSKTVGSYIEFDLILTQGEYNTNRSFHLDIPTGDRTYYRVRYDDNLTSISKKFNHLGGTVSQRCKAFFHINPDKFYANNPDFLKKGGYLAVPSPSLVTCFGKREP